MRSRRRLSLVRVRPPILTLVADIIQETYLRELKSYKAPPKAPDAHKGLVREFSAPQQPAVPEIPASSELASQLDAYTAAEPDAAESPKPANADATGSDAQDVNAYLQELQADVKVEAHH